MNVMFSLMQFASMKWMPLSTSRNGYEQFTVFEGIDRGRALARRELEGRMHVHRVLIIVFLRRVCVCPPEGTGSAQKDDAEVHAVCSCGLRNRMVLRRV